MSDVVLFIDNLRSSSSLSICRICHEEELESCKNLEAPCACSGTVKFAHRDCIQRWCDEKGNTVCELCLQKFEPGYTCPPKKVAEPINTTVTIRVTPRSEIDEADLEELRIRNLESALAAERSGSRCRSVATIFTALLLLRHMFAVMNGAPEDYPFSLITILIAKASGVIVPMYILIRITDAIHFRIKRQYQNPNVDLSSDEEDDEEDEERPREVDRRH